MFLTYAEPLELHNVKARARADNISSNQVEATPQPATNWIVVATAILIAAVIVLAASLSART